MNGPNLAPQLIFTPVDKKGRGQPGEPNQELREYRSIRNVPPEGGAMGPARPIVELGEDSSNQNVPPPVIALAGNPNTGKTTLFNALTGLNQHTGNWPGKTVLRAQGTFIHRRKKFVLVDLPGTYSLLANSPEEQVARDYLCYGDFDATIVVVDATSLERNLNLVLQVMEITDKVVICLNLIDEAERKGISINTGKLSEELGVPVVPVSARYKKGIIPLLDTTEAVVTGKTCLSPRYVRYDEDIERAVQTIQSHLTSSYKLPFNPRWLALRILEGDQSVLDGIKTYLGVNIELGKLAELQGLSS